MIRFLFHCPLLLLEFDLSLGLVDGLLLLLRELLCLLLLEIDLSLDLVDGLLLLLRELLCNALLTVFLLGDLLGDLFLGLLCLLLRLFLLSLDQAIGVRLLDHSKRLRNELAHARLVSSKVLKRPAPHLAALF